MNNSWFDIINAVDDGNEKNEVINELSDPRFALGSRATVTNLIKQMLAEGYLKQITVAGDDVLLVTPKGRSFYERTTFS